MAGKIEEPFRLSFQADTLHSGSISFGRFEAESLSWERRSAFSHNKYLEEVEKYSKPGSVTEKKAYFEAHFRRKALLSQSSSDCQSGIDYQASENDTSEIMRYEEFEQNDEGSPSVQFDKSSVGSEYDGDSEVMKCDREDMGTSHAEPLFGPALSDTSVVQIDCEHVNPKEAPQIEIEGLGKKEREKLIDKAINVDLACNAIRLSTNRHTTSKGDSASLERQQESSLKVGSKLGSKIMKAKSKSPINITPAQRNVSSEPSKDAAKKPIRIESEGSHSTKTEKQSSRAAAPTTRSVHTTSKPEDSKSLKLKVFHDSRSEKELKSKKVVERKLSVSEKIIPNACQTTNRLKQAENSTKSGMKQSFAVFNFKSNERAERRKELEEKTHAKEAGVNAFQAKKLEMTGTEIKQLRKSLNFRATPLPSFYHEAVQHDSDKNKVASVNSKSSKLRSRPTPGFEAATKPISRAKAGNDRVPFSTEPVNTSDPPKDSAATNCSLTPLPCQTGTTSQTPLTHTGHPQLDEINCEVTCVKGSTKKNDASFQKDRGLGNSKATKGQRSLEGNSKVEMGRSGDNKW
ncbi:hypothetical protein U1Q18_002157 [Sarracenia purpurea var. burkii]